MNKTVKTLAVVLCLGVLSSQALATDGSHSQFLQWLINLIQSIFHHSSSTTPSTAPGSSTSVPEMDVAVAGIALALLGGLFAIKKELGKRK